MSIYSSKRKTRTVSKTHSGHLKLSVIEESSALVVHIFEARGLQRRGGASLDTYVKIYLLPDPHKQTKERTKNVKQKDPLFNQKFSFILGEADHHKQLFISVWTHQVTSRNEMLGCMTFSVADLLGPNKGLNGWYQVLDEARGRNENLAVPTSISKHDSTMSKYESTALIGQKVFAVMVMKGPKGYGFSVSVNRPVHITEVVKDLPAANADLRVGDIILELQGTSVKTASGNEVVAMIQKSPNTVHMILQRDLANPQHLMGTRPSQLMSQFNSLSRSTRSKSSLSINTPSTRLEPQDSSLLAAPPKQTPRKRHSMHYSSQSQLMPEYHQNPYQATLDTSPQKRTLVGHFATLRRGNRGTYGMGPEAAMLSQPEPTTLYEGVGYAQGGTPGMSGGLYPESMSQVSYGSATVQNSSSRKKVRRKKSPSPSDGRQGELGLREALSQPSEPPMEFPGSRGGGSMRNPAPARPPPEGRPSDNMFGRKGSRTQQDGEERGILEARMSSVNPRHAAPTRPAPRPPPSIVIDAGDGGNLQQRVTEDELVDWASLTPQEQKRQKAIQNISSAEFSLCKVLKVGVETYLRPLKSALTEESYDKIFQGIPELFAFSREFCDRLNSRKKPYADITESTSPSHHLHTFADIYAAKLKGFVETLKLYARNSHVARQEIALSFTNDGFTTVAESAAEHEKPDIFTVVGAGKEYIQTLSKWMAKLFYLTAVDHPDQKYLHSIVNALIPLSSDKDLQQKWERDYEVMKNKQLCVGFGPWVPVFPVLVPGRVLVHEGEVNVVEKKKKKKLWLMLFSDIVLLTQRHGKIFTCIEKPILLENLTVPDINCSEPTDFQLVDVEGTLNRLIRGPSVAARDKWVAELKERASGSLANRKRPGEKFRSSHQLQHQLKKQSHLLAATLAVDFEVEVTSHNHMTPILESAGEKAGNRRRRTENSTDAKAEAGPNPESSLSQPTEQADASLDLKRGVTKRRSLFNVGKAKEGKAKPKDKKKSSKLSSSSSTSSSPIMQEGISLSEISVEVLREWETSFNALLKHPDGLELFEGFLKSEFSEENIQFWKACERYKTVPDHMVEKEASIVYEEYVAPQAPKLVNIDHQTSREIVENMKSPNKATFSRAQQSIYLLMARDSFVRFVKSDMFQQALKR